MRSTPLALALVLVGSMGAARDAQLLDPGFFGESTSRPVTMLLEKKGDEVGPSLVQVDVEHDRYRAATAFYSKRRIGMEEVRASLDALYAEHRQGARAGSVSDDVWCVAGARGGAGLAIRLAEASEDRDLISVIYLSTEQWGPGCARAKRSVGQSIGAGEPEGPTIEGPKRDTGDDWHY